MAWFQHMACFMSRKHLLVQLRSMYCTQQEDNSFNVPVYNMHTTLCAPSAYTETSFCGLHYGCMETHLTFTDTDLDTYERRQLNRQFAYQSQKSVQPNHKLFYLIPQTLYHTRSLLIPSQIWYQPLFIQKLHPRTDSKSPYASRVCTENNKNQQNYWPRWNLCHISHILSLITCGAYHLSSLIRLYQKYIKPWLYLSFLLVCELYMWSALLHCCFSP